MKITEEELRRILCDVCGTADALKDGVDLLDSGLLDSLAFISLLEELEDRGVEIQPTQVDRNRFRTMEGILSLIREME